MNKQIDKTQLVIIGAGPGGYTAAFLAADLGMEVTLIDPDAVPGGVCLYRGCIPTKALLHAAAVLKQTRDAHIWGMTSSQPGIDLTALMSWKENVVKRLSRGLTRLSRQRGIRYIQGTAKFIGPHTLEITSKTKQRFRLSFTHSIVATGARPTQLPNAEFSPPHVVNSTHALESKNIPPSLLVIGAGYIGLELGSFFAEMGSGVTIAEMLPDVLAAADRDIVSVFLRETKKLFDSILLNTTVRLEKDKNHIKALFYRTDDEKNPYLERIFDSVLVTIGRKPNSQNLGLENTCIETDTKGFIKTNNHMRTSEPHIYAVGDVSGAPLLAHKAFRQAAVSVENINGKKSTFEDNLIPAVEYTDPEIAWCGLTEQQARKQKRKIKTARFPWGASGRSATLGISSGLTKLIVDPRNEKILGAAIVGRGAGELISELTLAVKLGATVNDVRTTIHPHPSLSETIMEAAAGYYGLSTALYNPTN